jgi:hypothetical protein
MPGLIDSSPDCVVSNEQAGPADDAADFILQNNYQDCTGFMTFGPGSTYGDEGAAADTAYYILTWLGIVVMVACLIAWVVWETRQLIGHVARLAGRGPAPAPPAPQPGTQREEL